VPHQPPAMTMPKTFYAYPSAPDLIADTVEQAVANLRENLGVSTVKTWRENDIAGRFIAHQVLESIDTASLMIADITQLNFNVAYEIGFALARQKRVILTRHAGVKAGPPLAADVGIFDTLGFVEYPNATQLEEIVRRSAKDCTPSVKNIYPQNQNVPVYLIEARIRTDPVTRIISRVKKARLFFRSYDPQESARLSGSDAFTQVAESYGVLLHLLSNHMVDAPIHNIRVAFLAGLAEGFGRVLLLLQEGEEPVPIDYRDLVRVFTHPSHIDEAIAEFATRVTEALQEGRQFSIEKEHSLLERLSFGASAAENELRDLGSYYLETDPFQRALRGEVRLVVGRKGSGKTAVFAQVRDRLRRERQNIILDLRPDGYQLLKFKEMVLRYLGPGALEHVITAFWEYLLLLEVCHKILEKDRIPHTRDSRLLQPYRRLSSLYKAGCLCQ
jgi:hypothetical protein